MYTVRIFDAESHTDTEYATAEEAFGAVYVDALPLPEQAVNTEPMPYGLAIFHEGVCFHAIGDRVEIGDPL